MLTITFPRHAHLGFLLLVIVSVSHLKGQVIERRIDDLIRQMTLEEKILQLNQDETAFGTRSNARLGIPGFRMADGPHGVREGTATSFPVGIGLAATWDTDLAKRIGIAMGKEFRGKGKNQALGPCLDLDRDPRNGRSPETGGEDPYLCAQITTEVVKGIQSQGCIATIKHYNANHRENGRMTNNILATQRTLNEHNGLAFRTAVQEGGAFSVMNAYNLINGEKCAENRNLLTDILRTGWGFPYYVVSDWGSIWNSAKAINAGCDICMGDNHYLNDLAVLVNGGTISVAVIDSAVRRVLRTKFASGVMDHLPPGNPADVNSAAHRELCREAARKSLVLLKNANNFLPLTPYLVNSVALIGPNAAVAVVDGGGSSYVTPAVSVSPKQGLEARLGAAKVTYVKGCDVNSSDTSGFADARDAAYHSDYVMFVGGLDPSQESEGMDRVGGSTALPGKQQALINELAKVNRNIIVVIYSGGICSLGSSIQNARALVYAFYPGQESGTALAELVCGDISPSGKLPVTMPTGDSQLPAWNDDFTDDGGGGYRWFDMQNLTPQFAFGYGLSYTTFVQDSLAVSPSTVNPGEPVTVQVTVTNLGSRAGDEIVQLYLTNPGETVSTPEKQLRQFQRVSLASGASMVVTFTLTADELYYFNEQTGRFDVESGTYTVRVGNSSDNLPLTNTFTVTNGVRKPDLRVTSIRPLPRYPIVGDHVAFAATVKNQGASVIPAGTMMRTHFMVEGTSVGWIDTLHADLVPGGMVYLEATHGPSGEPLWTAATVGRFAVQARADENNAIDEWVESNNMLTDSMTVSIRPPENLALNKTATSSPIEAVGLDASKAVDGDMGTRWSSVHSDPQWIQVDLGARYHIDDIVVYWEAAYATDYYVLVFDGDSTHVVASVVGGDGGIDILPANVTGSKIKIIGTKRGTIWGYSIYELEVHGARVTAIEGEGENRAVGSFELEGNYPNPFNPETVVSYQLSVISDVDLRIYDLLGREVVSLVNQEMPAGRHSVVWNAASEPSGIYLCRLAAGKETATTKLVLLR